MGSMDGFLDNRGYLRAVDFAGGKLFIEEAGGVVTNRENEEVKGEIDVKTTSSMVAGPPSVHSKLIEYIGD